MRSVSGLLDSLARLGRPPCDLGGHGVVFGDARLFVVLSQAEAVAIVAGLSGSTNVHAQRGRTTIQTALYGVTRTGAQA